VSTAGPIEKRHYDTMNRLAEVLDDALNKYAPKKYGFTLLVFEFNTTDGRMNYISNANRPEMITAMKEFIANCEGRMIDKEGNA